MNTMNINTRSVIIPIEQLYTAPEYQREHINKRRVTYLVSNWDWNAYTPIKVCIRKNEPNKYFVVEGQHRVIAAKIQSFIDLPAMIVETQSIAEEAALFRAVNGAGGSLRLNQYDEWKAAIIAEDDEITTLNNIITKYRFKISWHSGDNHITAVHSVKRLSKKYGVYIFDQTLEIIRICYNGDSMALQGKFLTGLAHFLYSYIADENFDRKRIINTLRKTPCVDILRELNRKCTAGRFGAVANEVFGDIYNSGLRNVNKLTLKA